MMQKKIGFVANRGSNQKKNKNVVVWWRYNIFLLNFGGFSWESGSSSSGISIGIVKDIS